MKRAKSEKRKLAELVSKQRGIKVKSAYKFIRRAEVKGEVPKRAGLSKYAAGKLRKDIKAAPAVKARGKRPVEISDIVEVDRVNFRFTRLEVFKGYGRFRLGSGFQDVRWRWIREMFSNEMVNDVLNAGTWADAWEVFMLNVSYIDEVVNPGFFEFRGVRYGREFFGEREDGRKRLRGLEDEYGQEHYGI